MFTLSVVPAPPGAVQSSQPSAEGRASFSITRYNEVCCPVLARGGVCDADDRRTLLRRVGEFAYLGTATPAELGRSLRAVGCVAASLGGLADRALRFATVRNLSCTAAQRSRPCAG